MAKFKVVVGYSTNIQKEAEIIIEAEDNDEAWERAFAFSDDKLSSLKYKIMNEDHSDFEISVRAFSRGDIMINFLYIFDKEVSVEDRLDYLFDIADGWLFEGRFERCDELIAEFSKHLDLDKLDMLIGLITILWPARFKFKELDSYISKVYEMVEEKRGKKYAKSLMVGWI